MSSQPPKWAKSLLNLLCADQFIDELEGDLYELYQRDIASYGLSKANWKYIWAVLFSIRMYRTKLPFQLKIEPMLKFNLLIAVRHGIKNLSFSLINLFGLSFGIAATLFIALFALRELNYDGFHENKSQLHRAILLTKDGTKHRPTPSLLGESIANIFPDYEICRIGQDPIKIGEEKPVLIEDFYWSDANFFKCFSFPLLRGNPSTALDKPNSLVLTASMAQQLFPDSDPFGKTIDIKIYDSDKLLNMKITGIAADPPKNSTIQFQGLGSMQNAENMYANLVDSWYFSWLSTFVMTPMDHHQFDQKNFSEILGAHLEKVGQKDINAWLQPITSLHLNSKDIVKSGATSSMETIYIIGAIGSLILLISVLNYINLNTARAFTRVEELKIKQALGSYRSNILAQYIIEALLYICLSAAIGLIITIILIDPFNRLFNLDVSLNSINGWQWVYLFLALIVTGFFAGTVSGIKLLQGILAHSGMNISDIKEKRSSSRKIIMGIQYIITIFLTAGTLLVYMQFNFMSNFNLGFNAEQLIYVPIDDRALQQNIHSIKDEFAKIPGVVATTVSGEKLPSEMNNSATLTFGPSDANPPLGVDIVSIDENYFDVIGIEIVEGKRLTKSYRVDSARSIIINQEITKILDDDAGIGKKVNIGGREREIAGVIDNHHYTSLHNKIHPVVYLIGGPGARDSPDNIFLRIETNQLNDLYDRLTATWQKFSADPLAINYVSKDFEMAYTAERKLMLLTNTLTLIAIVIAFLGLFGLTTFMVRQKIKELCIRKVLGASILHIGKVLSADFFKIFGIATLVASPLTYYFGKAWLAEYPYHTGFNFSTLILAVGICLLISVVVIGLMMLKLSSLQPAKLLRNE